jgi:opacity protein-like surface antigen
MFMKTISRVLASLVLVATASMANAQTAAKDFYVEGGLLGLKFADSKSSTTPLLARLTVGKEINRNLAVEGMAGFTLSKDEDLSATTTGAFLKPKFEISKDVEAFARVGVAHVATKYKTGSYSTTKAAYGFGVQMQLNKNVYGQVDYMHYGKDDAGSNARGFTVSIGTRF